LYLYRHCSQREELVMTKCGDDPAFHDLHATLRFSFGEKRALQIVLMVAHKFSPSRIRSTH